MKTLHFPFLVLVIIRKVDGMRDGSRQARELINARDKHEGQL